VEDVATDLGQPLEGVRRAVAELGGRGQLRVDQEVRIVGSAGLSIGPDRHQIDIAGRRFWTWCAYDILWIYGGLGASGTAHSPSPVSDEPLEVAFVGGRPQPSDLVVFRPDESWRDCCANVYEEWCPNSNFFEDREAALAWAAGRGLTGRVLPLAEASELATREWEATAGGLLLPPSPDPEAP
jgi:alkylmercury lyase